MRTHERLSEKEHRVNAMASGADEGRDKLRLGANIRLTRRFPNGGIRL